jgi:uncharacterized membrane protein YbhN (UPF0104 family)
MNTALRLTLSLALAAGLVMLLLHWSGTEPGEIFTVLGSLDASVYWTALGVQVLIYPLRAKRLRTLLPAAHPVPTMRLIPITAAHVLASNVLPAKVGEASLVLYLRRAGNVPAAHGTAVLYVSRVLDFATLTGAMAAACLILEPSPELPELPWMVPLGMSLGVVTLALAWLAASGGRLVSLATGLLSLLHLDSTGLGARVVGFAERLRESLAQVGRRQLWSAAALGVPIWILVFVFYAILAQGLGLSLECACIGVLGFADMVFGVGLGILGNMIPINGFGGFGLQDMGWAAGFTALGVHADLAASTGLAAHVVYLFNISLLGLLGHTLMGLSRRARSD